MKLLFIVLLCLLLTAPLRAQEATPEVTATPDGVTVVVQQPDALPTLVNFGILLAGFVVAGGSFALVWERLRRSKEAKDTIEMLHRGLSPEWKSTIDRVLDLAEQVNTRAGELLEFARDVTDDKPNT